MVLPRRNNSRLAECVTAGLSTVAIRVPAYRVAHDLITQSEVPIAAPSANKSGYLSPTSHRHVKAGFKSENVFVIDSETNTKYGLESTIIDCTHAVPRILRPGSITADKIQISTGLKITDSDEAFEMRVSGSLEKHYAPAAQVLLDITPTPGQGFIALSHIKTPEGVTRLAAPSNANEFARELYAALRKADEMKLATVVVEQPLGEGIAIAIRDRLRRAANGR
jgi:L-threonylcarbamoyladenylate synthase